MKNVLFFCSFLWCNFLISQSILLPSENIVKAFEAQYPKKNPNWSMQYGSKADDITFVAKFKSAANTQAYAVYESNGNFKAYKEQISSTKLPANIQLYLDANYPIKSNSKTKTKSKSKEKSKVKTVVPVREAYSVVDAKNKMCYEVKVKKDGKNYNLLFDAEGNLIKTIEIA